MGRIKYFLLGLRWLWKTGHWPRKLRLTDKGRQAAEALRQGASFAEGPDGHLILVWPAVPAGSRKEQGET